MQRRPESIHAGVGEMILPDAPLPDSARPPCGDLPRFLDGRLRGESFELFGGPFRSRAELGRARHARADVVGQVELRSALSCG